MREHITYDKFLELKSEMFLLYNEYETKYENTDENEIEQLEQEFINKYLVFQNELLSYDLSSINFDSWEGMLLLEGDKPFDMTGTNANIDFELVEVLGKGIFKTCNVKNVGRYPNLLDQKYYDQSVIDQNPRLFLSNLFSDEFKEKYYSKGLKISDLTHLSDEAYKELQEKLQYSGLLYIDFYYIMGKIFDLKKLAQIYEYSEDIFNLVNKCVSDYHVTVGIKRSFDFDPKEDEFYQMLNQADIKDLKQICFNEYYKLFNDSYSLININEYPELFVKENPQLFLIGLDVKEDFKNRYFNKNLLLEDILENLELFKDINIDNFTYDSFIGFLYDNYNKEEIYPFLNKYKAFLKYVSRASSYYLFINNMQNNLPLEEAFVTRLIELAKNRTFPLPLEGDEKLNPKFYEYDLFIDKLYSFEDLKEINGKPFIMDNKQRLVVELFGLENIIKLDEETKFFSHVSPSLGKLGYFDVLFYYLDNHEVIELINITTYEEARDYFAKLLGKMRHTNIFTDYPDYGFITGPFREKYNEIFISKDAPDDLKHAFYGNKITADLLYKNPEFAKYLLDKNLKNIIAGNFDCSIYNSSVADDNIVLQNYNFIDFYTERFGNEAYLKLLTTYGWVGTSTSYVAFDVNSTKEEIDNKYVTNIFNNIVKGKYVNYKYLLSSEEFVKRYPSIFITPSEVEELDNETKKMLVDKFYNRMIDPKFICEHPEVIPILKDKELKLFFAKSGFNNSDKDVSFWLGAYDKTPYTEIEYIDYYGNEKFLELCKIYGRYLNNTRLSIINSYDLSDLSYEQLTQKIEDVIAKECNIGIREYYDFDAPSFLKERCPDLFLDPQAPEKLKEFFYNINGYGLTFERISLNPEWQPFLEGKNIFASIYRANPKPEVKKYFDLFKDKAIKLGFKRGETVTHMIESSQVELMKAWYDKTGQRFIPDFTVMETFPLDIADKFLTNGKSWSKLMSFQNFAKHPESRDAMLKLAYSFGVFDGDASGTKKVMDLLSSVPRYITSEQMQILKSRELQILEYNRKLLGDDVYATMPLCTIEYGLLKAGLKESGISFTSEAIFDDLFELREDGKYTFKLNLQDYPNELSNLRSILEEESIVLSPSSAHQLFSGFALIYDKDFRDFFLKYYDELTTNQEYRSNLANIQKQFEEIKKANSNRVLTPNLALSFVQTNKYTNVQTGNEKVSFIASVAGYSQSDFNTLQEIYNYGKLRTKSSIPRIEGSKDGYNFEILRLDDPLAMAIGTLTDCCQELGNVAETCMMHSMTSNHGRVFVIKDSENNIIAQSWVWRNKNVLCFDNIEIPAKAFSRAKIEGYTNSSFADTVYEIYKNAARMLIEEDKKVYLSLLEEKQMTSEQVAKSRITKVTVGAGYNDIHESLKRNTKNDNTLVARPLPYKKPVDLPRSLYTSDSTYQYVLEKDDDYTDVYEGKTLQLHSDNYFIYDDNSFTESLLIILNKLELASKKYKGSLYSSVYDTSKKDIISQIAQNYGIDSNNVKLLMHTNFAILYEDNSDEIRVIDMYINFDIKVNFTEDEVKNMLGFAVNDALKYISNNKNINLDLLDNQTKDFVLETKKGEESYER